MMKLQLQSLKELLTTLNPVRSGAVRYGTVGYGLVRFGMVWNNINGSE